jgi:hypothetical protein
MLIRGMVNFWTNQNRHLFALLALTIMSPKQAFGACESNYLIQLETFGEGVRVELRAGAPGSSKVVNSSFSTGGQVRFTRLCAGTYFLAIGNGEDVSVTPVRYYEDYTNYSSSIVIQRGSGNVSKKSRKSL